MRIVNLVAMALVAAATVVVAVSARHAHSQDIGFVWVDGLAEPLKDISIYRRRDGFIEEAGKFAGVDGAIGVLRQKSGPLPVARTIAARDRDAFLHEVSVRFDAEAVAVRPLALTPMGQVRSGFVARVVVGDKRCDFAIAGYSADPTGGDIDAVARAFICGEAAQLTPPDIRVAGLLAREETH